MSDEAAAATSRLTVTRTVKTTTSTGGSVTVTTTETSATGDEAKKLLADMPEVKLPELPDLSSLFDGVGKLFDSIFPKRPKAP